MADPSPYAPNHRLGGHYVLLRKLGEGAFGEVHAARHDLLGQDFAVKVLKPELCSQQEVRDRFLDEARALIRFSHPNVVQLRHVGEEEGRLFLVMDFVRGEPLDALLAREGPMSEARAVALASQMLQGLDAAHAKGIVHRDLKPANLMVERREDGTEALQILDFGLSKLSGSTGGIENAHRSMSGSIVGTLAYMSPEQLQGQGVDPRSDVFAAGLVLMEMLQGRHPYADESGIMVAARMLREPLPPLPAEVAARTSAPVRDALKRALERERDARWPSAKDFAAALAGPAAAEARAARSDPGAPAPQGLPRPIGSGASRYVKAGALDAAPGGTPGSHPASGSVRTSRAFLSSLAKGVAGEVRLPDVLQTLAHIHKAGTLVLETESGTRTVVLADGKASFTATDPHAAEALARCLRRAALVPEQRLEGAVEAARKSGVFLGDVLAQQQLLGAGQVQSAWTEASTETLSDMQLLKSEGYRFVEGEVLGPDGKASRVVEPGLPVEQLLPELARKLDAWAGYRGVLPSMGEVFEPTGRNLDLATIEGLDIAQAERVRAAIDGCRDLARVAEHAAVARFTAVQVAVALLEGGAIRAVPTDDLVTRAEQRLDRGEAAVALPLLRRALQREDAPARTRVRLADAFEGAGDATAAADLLVAWAADAAEHEPAEAFSALLRASRLRDGDPASLGQACDHWLRYRPRLRSRTGEAREALRALVSAATARATPLVAAPRLLAFLDAGEVPSEELVALAELYAAGADGVRAAEALARRAEQLAQASHEQEAREMFVRALQLDATRKDVRVRLDQLAGIAAAARRRRRLVAAAVLLVVSAGAAGWWWWDARRQWRDGVRESLEQARAAVVDAESQAARKVAEFRALLAEASGAAGLPAGLRERATRLVEELGVLAQQPGRLLDEHEQRLVAPGNARRDDDDAAVSALKARQSSIRTLLDGILVQARKDAAARMQEGQDAFRTGSFRKAIAALRAARNLALEDEAVREQAVRMLANVEQDVARIDALKAGLEADRARGDLAAAAQKAVAALTGMLDSDLAREVRIPLEITSTPSGAQVLLGSKDTTQVTPCVIGYSPFEDALLTLRMPGRTAASVRMPAANEFRDGKVDAGTFQHRIHRVLPEGPRWTLSRPLGQGIKAAWTGASDLPLVLLEDGRTSGPVDPVTGTLGATVRQEQAEPVRHAGAWPGGADWRIAGNRRLRVKPGGGAAWEVELGGRLLRTPALHDGIVCSVDEQGTLYGHELGSGREAWRVPLANAPAQAPQPTARGFVISTIAGGVTLHAARNGTATQLAPAGRGLTLAAAHGDGILLLGTGEGGIRRLDAAGQASTLGTASPVMDREPAPCPEGVAWVASDGTWWLATGSAVPLRLEALGPSATHVVADARGVVAAGNDKVLRCVLPAQPTTLRWSTALPSAPRGPLMASADAIYVLAGDALIAVDR